jgi:hypothetical protein
VPILAEAVEPVDGFRLAVSVDEEDVLGEEDAQRKEDADNFKSGVAEEQNIIRWRGTGEREDADARANLRHRERPPQDARAWQGIGRRIPRVGR